MNNALKVIGLVVAITLVFSLRIGEKTVFGHIYSSISPATIAAQDTFEDLFSRGYHSTSTYSKKLFSNSIPKVKDSVSSGLSAVKKSTAPAETILLEEKEKLDELIKTHR